MYLHLGMDKVITFDEIIGIFDLDTTTVSKRTRDYLANLLLASDSFAPYIITILPTYNGIIIFTDEPEKLSEELKSIM